MATCLAHGCGGICRPVIKFFGQNGGLGVAQSQYAQTGRIIPRKVPSILLQAFISLWSGAPVGPEGPLTFLTGGFGKPIFQNDSNSRKMMFSACLQFNSRGIRRLLWFTRDWSCWSH